ncbi:MAG: alpha-2-macroglobulin [Acidobacteria bacterium]|nr:alpha-2-macroglobulin [Acidobacteriota bacterium]
MTRRMFGMAVGLVVLSLGTHAQTSTPPRPATAAVQRPADGSVIVPDRFLRRWDPVTIFFSRDAGPSGPGPEDNAARFATVKPTHPGQFQWLDARTLQFRPAEPWPSLARFTWTVEGRAITLSTLMSPPERTVPEDGAEGLERVDEIALTFAQPLDPGALARMVQIELRPLPGIGGSAASRTLPRDDISVKAVERANRSDAATYVLTLKEPIPLGTRAVVHFRLTLDDRDEAPFKQISFSTAEPFRVVSVGCRDQQLPVTPQGTRYAREQAIACRSGDRTVVVDFSAPPREVSPVEARNLVRLTPPVGKLSFDLQHKRLEISGDFAWDTLYTVSVEPAPIVDTRGRRLEMGGRSDVPLHFTSRPPYVKWTVGRGIAERFGPMMVPVIGRGEERVDLRIHRIAPLDRSYWPFPQKPVLVDEGQRPPSPGEEPSPWSESTPIPEWELRRRLRLLGSPLVSTLVDLPLRKQGGAASFGLDLAPYFERIAGKAQPGTYLVGLRDLASQEHQRAWMRLQVTDLVLTAAEEPKGVRFFVTSLSTGSPVIGARIRVEGQVIDRTGNNQQQRWSVLAEGETDTEGAFRWTAPGYDPARGRNIRRIVVEKDGDTLTLDPADPPELYHDNQWSDSNASWLQWAFEPLDQRGAQPAVLAHIFTERPVYRPEEEVHIKGYLRSREKGRLTPVKGEGWVIVEGPGDLGWKYAATLTEAGSFYHLFKEKDLPTGSYRAHWEDKERKHRYGDVSFQVEAYRLPTFELTLSGPEQANLDRSFEISLTATYYAGGRVGGQPLHWRVTQFPLEWAPKQRAGFRYSSDSRYSRSGRFTSTPRIEREDVTDAEGSARLTLNPAIEPTAEPRNYVVEATVTGPDDQPVTVTRIFPALPPFVLGLKTPRFLERAKSIPLELLVAGPDGQLIGGQDVTVRLVRREWHSHLQRSDFSEGIARYITDVVDVKVSETKVKSGNEPLSLPLAIDRAGVYVVEIESHDRLGRAQVVSADLYASGDEPVTWPKPVTPVFSVATDKPRYDPGMTANLVLKSPFQSARVLAVIEAPDGNEYRWIDVQGGAATFPVAIQPNWNPRIPVHFVLMRGRLVGTQPVPGNATDLGKPATLAATAWIDVNPVAHRATVELRHPATARPGQTIEVEIRVKDPQGKPLSGEVTLWLVDQAVLALGKEQRLDPVPDFVQPVSSFLNVHDTRNLAFGVLPFAENPGGDGGEEGGILDRATVRKNFKVVPYYNPRILVGPDGVVKVKVALSDDLTNFKLRAKVASGTERFGFATGHLAIRLPLIVQPALPRFVRPGDRFTAAAIGRVVEGSGGAGAAELRAEGVAIEGPRQRAITWTTGKPERIEFAASVPTPRAGADGRLERSEVKFKMGVSRASDGATDAFEVLLPLRDDREPVVTRMMTDLLPGKPLSVPAVNAAVRAGTLRREILVSTEPALVRMAAGLSFLLEYPYGCTEQQTSRARAILALRRFRDLLKQEGGEARMDRAVNDALAWIPTTVDRHGLVAYWPGGEGRVSLTAWTVQFLLEAKSAGYAVDEKLLARLVSTLKQALRSDYGRFIDGESFAERSWALVALTQAGQPDTAYAAELQRKAQYLDTESLAHVLFAFAQARESSPVVAQLTQALWKALVFRLYQGREVYGGLQDRSLARSSLILPSETRTVAEVTRALVRQDPKNPRLRLLADALVTLGQDDGWGQTNANGAALLALSELLQSSGATAPVDVVLRVAGREQSLRVGGETSLASVVVNDAGPLELTVPAGTKTPLIVRLVTRYVPAADGSQVAAEARGFVVSREMLRMLPGDAPPEKLPLTSAGMTQTFRIGDVVEEHVQVVNPKERAYVAFVVPLAAGMEPLNPALATAPPEARPSHTPTLAPTYVAFLDDKVAYFYDRLPAGTYDVWFRTRATTAGSFRQPPAKAEMMYDASVVGISPGALIQVDR